MQYSILLVPVVLPALFWAWYHYHKDSLRPEPPVFLALAFVAGIGSFWLGKALYVGLGYLGLRYDAFALASESQPGLFLYAVLAIGPIEEISKLLPFLVIARRLPAFDEPIDGIIYASFIALGFAAMENVAYFKFLTSAEALARGFVGPVVHIAFASVWGYFIGRACLAGNKLLPTTIVAVSSTAFLHGLYDYLVIGMPGTALPLSAALVVALWIWRMFLLRRLRREAARQ